MQITGILNMALQLVLIVLWSTATSSRITYTIPTTVLSLASSMLLMILSMVEHTRSIKPSALLGIYLIVSVLIGVVRTRTSWQTVEGQILREVFSVSLAIQLTLLILESWPKTRFLLAEDHELSPEETSGILGKSVYAWLNSLIIRGYREPLSWDDLYPMPGDLLAAHLSARFHTAWVDSE